ncbi:MAG: aminoglycoside phosphotransferase (APT) family kinase protein [Lentimonas sp.]|jgi:aminoglycoside phosphotransferase (APT) family kinase protein
MLRRVTGAEQISPPEVIQSLWSGYGSIVRYHLSGAKQSSVVVKHVSPPTARAHPRGWNTDLSHARKLQSYQVETAWYQHWAAHCDSSCRVPHCLAVESTGDEVLLVLEDLDAAGFGARRTQVTPAEVHQCIAWLAQFHATFLKVQTQDLWAQGTYWHLATRPDELQVLASEDPTLHAAARAIDRKLNAARFQTLVHGDAKLANFCFSDMGQGVAAVDFQYVGAGCGMQDLAYFMGSCLSEAQCERAAAGLLDYYFSVLQQAISAKQQQVDAAALELEWRALYPVAWTDFHRFLKGWSPGHWKLNTYSERLARVVLAEIMENGTCN